MRATTCKPTAGVTSICPRTKVNNYPANLRVKYGQHVGLVGSLDRNYRYKSVATQFPDDVTLAPIPPKIGPAPCYKFKAVGYPLNLADSV